MSLSHVLLIVTPDPDAARALRGLVESMGHVAWEAPSLDEARVALAKNGCCGVVLDAAIDEREDAPRRHGARRRLPALDELRSKDPRRNAAGTYVLPIVVLVEENRDVEELDSLFSAGASSVVRKPVTARRETLARKIEQGLRYAGREDHAACGVVAVAVPGRGAHLELTGERKRGRTGVRMNGKPGHVRNGHFVMLLKLGVVHGRVRGGWQAKHQLGVTRNPEVPSRLRKELKALAPVGFEPIEADWGGSFRLNPEMTVEIDLDALEEHPLAVVRKIVKEEKELRARRKKRA